LVQLGEIGVEDWLETLAVKQGMAADYSHRGPETDDDDDEDDDRYQFALEDIGECQDYLEEVFHDPSITSWLDLIKSEQGVAEGLDLEEQFNIIESMIEYWAEYHGVDSDVIWEDLESVDDHELLDESAAWHRSAGKNKNGGLNKKGVASYRREHPGSKLQTAVTTKPSKLKPGSKAAKRRKSFCARMGGMKGPMKKPNGKPTRKALALRKWHC